MSRLKLSLLALGLLAAPLAQADVVGAAAGVEYWKQSPSGWLQDNDNGRVDVEDDLQLDNSSGASVWAALEHPLPVLPNLKLAYTPLELSGSGELTRSFTLADQTFSVSEQIHTDLKLNQYDLILYYEVLDNWLNLDVGMNIKVLDGEVSVRGGGREDKLSFSGPVPLLYANARVDVPTTGWNTGLEVSALSLSGNSFVDARAHVGYEFPMGLEVRGGWRHQQLKLEGLDDVDADFKVSGPYVGVQVDF